MGQEFEGKDLRVQQERLQQFQRFYLEIALSGSAFSLALSELPRTRMPGEREAPAGWNSVPTNPSARAGCITTSGPRNVRSSCAVTIGCASISSVNAIGWEQDLIPIRGAKRTTGEQRDAYQRDFFRWFLPVRVYFSIAVLLSKG